jgi:poly-beta-hydroxybutyrate-responsive repressor
MASAQGNTDAAEPRLTGDMLTTSLLAFLKNWDAYGYELNQRLAATGLPMCDSGTVYRTLRQLEKTGLVSSFWDTSANGPARRMYSLTKAGEIMLESWLGMIRDYQKMLTTVLGGQIPGVGSDEPAPDEEQN